MVKRAFVVGVIAVALVGLLLSSQRAVEPLRVSGFVEADEIRIGSRVGGRVKTVAVGEGQTVTPGQTLIELEPYDLLERRAEGAAQLEMLRTRLSKLEHGPRPQEIEAAKAQVTLATAQLDLTKITFARVSKSFAGNAATRDEMDRAEKELKSADAAVAVRQAELALLEEGTRAEDIAEARAAVDAAVASLAAIDRHLEELAVKAPAGGASIVESVDLQAGDMVNANAPVLSLMDVNRLWVRAYVPENRLGFALNHKVVVTVDSFPGERFAGHVAFISRNAEFTPGNVQTPEERSKQVFRIKVMLDTGLDRLRPGMAADVWLEEQP